MLGIRREKQKRCFGTLESGDMAQYILLEISLYYNIAKYFNIVTFKYLNFI